MTTKYVRVSPVNGSGFAFYKAKIEKNHCAAMIRIGEALRAAVNLADSEHDTFAAVSDFEFSFRAQESTLKRQMAALRFLEMSEII